MKFLQIFRESLHLIKRGTRKRLLLLVIVQLVISLLDVLGVAILAFVSSTSLVNSIKIQDANTGHNNLLAPRNGFTSYFTQQSPVTLVLLGVFFFLIKNVLSVVFLKFTYKFLAKQSMAVSVDLMQKFFERNLTFVQSRDVQSTSIGLSLGVGFLLIDVLGSFVVLFSEVFMLLFLSILVLTVFPLEGFLSVIYFVSVLALMQKYVLGIASKAGHDKTRNDIESIQLIQGMFNLYREIRLSNGANFFNQSAMTSF